MYLSDLPPRRVREYVGSIGAIHMKDPMEVLQAKEQEMQRVKREIEALRVAVRLLEEDYNGQPESRRQLVEMP